MNKPTAARKENKRKTRSFVLESAFSAFAVLLSGFFFLAYPQQVAAGVSDGIKLCVTALVPSLFPFMVISNFFSMTDLCERLSGAMKKPLGFLFSLGKNCFCPVVVSLFGGYPAAAVCAGQLYENGKISQNELQRLLLFAMVPSPSFAVGTVGSAMLGSKRTGAFIWLSSAAASLLLGVFSRFVKTGEGAHRTEKRQTAAPPTLFSLFTRSLSKSGNAMLFVCFSVLFFSAVLAAFEVVVFDEGAMVFIAVLLEVSCGCKRACGVLPPEIIAGAVSFGGLCTHFQVMNEVTLSGLKARVFFVFRVLHGALSSVLCSLLLRFFREPEAVFSQSGGVLPFSGESPMLSLCLVAMCVLLLVGEERLTFSPRRKKET